MVKKISWLLLIIFIVLYNCAQPRYIRRSNLHSRRIKKIESERILYNTELKYKNRIVKRFVNHIRHYLGTPYKYGGTSKSGMDCSGFVTTIFKKSFDIELTHNTKALYNETNPLPSNRLIVGDLVFFENHKGKGVAHVGIYLIDKKFVHASSTFGVVVADLSDEYYLKRYKGARRVAKLKRN